MRAGAAGADRAELAGGVAHLRQHGGGNVEQRQELVVPRARLDVEEQGARGVGRVGGVDGAVGQFPKQKGIDGAERQFAVARPRPRAGHVIENPGELGRREIGIEHQAGARPDHRLMAFGLQPRAMIGGAAVLPDDRVVNRLAVGAAPHQRRFALVGQAESGDVLRAERARGEDVAHRRPRRLPQVGGIVLDPTGMRINLAKLLLRRSEGRRPLVEQDRSRRSRPLIDDENGGRHGFRLR